MSIYIIAEAGINHNGSLEKAMKMIEIAKDCGADAIKFQTFKTQNLVTPSAPMADYQKINTKSGGSQFEMLKNCELNFDQFINLHQACRNMEIDFLSTAFDKESLNFLINNLSPKYVKWPSGEINNYLLMEELRGTKIPILLSTGMSSMDEIRNSLNILRQIICHNDITLLQCTSNYPTDLKNVNLRVLQTFRNLEKDLKVGFSDHTLGFSAAIAAVGLDATVIEKHFTLNQNDAGPDHAASLNPSQLKEFIKLIREAELSLGSEKKILQDCEISTQNVARKSLFYAKSLKAGHQIQLNDLKAMRPNSFIPSSELYRFLNKKLSKDVEIEMPLEFDDIE